MNRRDAVLVLVASGVPPLATLAQRPARVRRIKGLAIGSAKASPSGFAAVREGMAELASAPRHHVAWAL